MKKKWKILLCVAIVMMVTFLCSFSAVAASAQTVSGDVAGAVENTWNDAQGQIKQVVNNVIFPVVDLILAVMFFVKLGIVFILIRMCIYCTNRRTYPIGNRDGFRIVKIPI